MREIRISARISILFDEFILVSFLPRALQFQIRLVRGHESSACLVYDVFSYVVYIQLRSRIRLLFSTRNPSSSAIVYRFLVANQRLYKPLCQPVRPLVGPEDIDKQLVGGEYSQRMALYPASLCISV